MSSINIKLETILTRLAHNGEDQTCYFDWDEVKKWPHDDLNHLIKFKILIPAPPKSILECHGCDNRCHEPVQIIPKTETTAARVYIQCGEHGVIDEDAKRLQQWQTSAQQLAQLIAECCDTQTHVAKDANHWRIGMFAGNKHREALLMGIQNNQITLKIAGHTVELLEVLSIKNSKLSIDLRKLKKMVDSPTGLPGGKETTEARGKRLLNRKRELQLEGVKNFIEIISNEEGLSASGISKLITKATEREETKIKSPFRQLL